ncbi:MAG TPA: biopolymer transporter ExbD [Thermoanaerobaculia bacterium]|jgi:biopolymer transport protein ExbD|nr:biopolymer transporter ExbD [Thermoanaerobaculia bacterium]
MAMNVGGGGGVRSDINITPLVDVVLVLLIIFMVAVPLLQMGYPVQVPPKVETAAPPPQSDDQVIVRMDGQGNRFINKTMYPENEFGAKLREAMTGRASKVVFFAADGELPYEKVAHFMDLCRNNGADNLGIVFDDLRAGGGASPAGAP